MGYLALVLSDAAYDAIPNSAPFVRPSDPGLLVITTSKKDDIAQQQVDHNEIKHNYNKCQAVEQALRKQLIEAIPAEYLDSLRNTDTDMIHDSIPAIIVYLQTNFGRITDQELSDKEDEVKTCSYDLSTPVDSVFNRIKAFQDLCVLTGNAKTDRQLVQLAYLVFNKTKAFMDSLKAWNAKLLLDKTFANFKIHMREEHHALRQVGALTIRDSEFSQANMIQQLTDHQQQLTKESNLQLASTMQENFSQAINMLQNTTIDSEDLPSTEQANNISDTTVSNTQLLAFLKTLQNKVDRLESKTPSPTTSNTSTINPRTGKEFKRYCFSCGCCLHWGKNCPQKKSGHKDDATFKDRMGGSNDNCMPNRT